MKHALIAIAFLALPAAAHAQALDFDAWSDCGEGSSVTLEVADDATYKHVTTLKKKTDDTVTLTWEETINGVKRTGERVIKKAAKPAECATCKTAHKETTVKQTGEKEKVKIGGKEFDATIEEHTIFGCTSELMMRVWRVKEVPGRTVKLQFVNAAKVTITGSITSFERK